MKSLLPTPRFLPYLAALAVAILYFLFQFHYMSQFLDWDQVWYLNNIIESGRAGTPQFFNPHHLHMEVGGRFFHDMISGLFGGSGFTDLPFNVRLRSVFNGCIALFFTVLYLKKATGKLAWGVIGALLVAVCHGFLCYSGKADTGIFPLAAVPPILWILERFSKTGRFSLPLAATMGITLFIAVMYHQYMLFMCFAVFFAVLLPRTVFLARAVHPPLGTKAGYEPCEIERRPARRIARLALFTALAAVMVLGAYLYVGKVYYNLPDTEPDLTVARGPYNYTTFPGWIMCYQAEGWWGTGFSEYDPREAVRGLITAFLSPTYGELYIRDQVVTKFEFNLADPWKPETYVYTLVLLLQAAAIGGTLLFLPAMRRRYGRSLVCLLLTLAAFSAFTAYWEPLYLEFWLIPAALLCILLVLVLNLAGEKISRVLGPVAHFPLYGMVLFLTLGLGSHNIKYFLIPYSYARHTEDMDPEWKEEYWTSVFSYSIYKNPFNTHALVKTMEPVRNGYVAREHPSKSTLKVKRGKN